MKYRRIRGDTIQVYKVLLCEDESLKALFNIDRTFITRGYNFKINEAFAKNKVCKHFFSIGLINDWNSLPPGVVNAVSLYSFKTKLDNIWSDKRYVFTF